MGRRGSPVHSGVHEVHRRAPRGQQGQGLGRGRRVRVRQGGRRRLQAHRPRGAHPRLPARQGAPQGPRGPARLRLAREEALRDALPEYYAQAVREHDVDVIAPPEIDITAGEEDGAVAFDAVVEVRPQIAVTGYDDLRVTIPSPVVTDEEIDAQVDRLRAELRRAGGRSTARPRTATTSPSTSPARRTASPSRASPPTTTSTRSARGAVVPELDDQLRGAKVGDILEFDADHPDPDSDAQLASGSWSRRSRRRCSPRSTTSGPTRPPSSRPSTSCAPTCASGRRPPGWSWPRWPCATARPRPPASWSRPRTCPRRWSPPRWSTASRTCCMRLQAQGMDFEPYLAATGQEPDGGRRGAARGRARSRSRPTSPCGPSPRPRPSRSTDDELDAELATLAERVEQKPGRGAPRARARATSSRRYARTSGSARPSSGWSARRGRRRGRRT